MNLKWAWDKVVELWYTPYYLWLYWSQNYWLDTDESDFDYKCIILPTLDELVNQTKPTSKTVEFEWGLIDIKDIRTYIDSAVKVNVNFIEILNTEYYLWDDSLRKYYKLLLDELWNQYLRACKWMLLEKYNALEKEYPSTKDNILKYWYDPKQLTHIVRLYILMSRYISWNYDLKIEWEQKDEIMKIKSWFYSLRQARVLASMYYNMSNELLFSYNKPDSYGTKDDLIKLSKEILKKNIIKSILESNQ